MQDWSPQATVHFINSLPTELTEAQMTELDESFGFSETRNAEISRVWFIQVATRRYLPAYGAMSAHLDHYGRIRLIQPVYQALAQNGSDATLAHGIFDAAKDKYHPLTVISIEYAFKQIE